MGLAEFQRTVISYPSETWFKILKDGLLLPKKLFILPKKINACFRLVIIYKNI